MKLDGYVVEERIEEHLHSFNLHLQVFKTYKML